MPSEKQSSFRENIIFRFLLLLFLPVLFLDQYFNAVKLHMKELSATEGIRTISSKQIIFLFCVCLKKK